MGLIIALFFVVLFIAAQVWMIMKISDLSKRLKELEIGSDNYAPNIYLHYLYFCHFWFNT